MKNIVENQGIKTDKPLPMSYEALKAERDAQQKRADALAVENAALKTAHPQPFGREMMKALDAYEKHQDEVPETGMLDAFFILRDSIRVETPATSAALAAIRTESHIAGVEAAANRIGVISLKYNPGQKHELIKAIGREVIKYATELREGK
ncbi:hypothetical protein [Serratia bockelmannii]|uniref:hypothetical protein n=1 Tax=Serratia bockelmannii TaxID=2703793 RepID=UPI0036BB056C